MVAGGRVDDDGAGGVGDALVTVIKTLILEIWLEPPFVASDVRVFIRSSVDTVDPDGIGGAAVTTTKGCDVTSPRELVVCEVDAVDADKNGTSDTVDGKGCEVISEVDSVDADESRTSTNKLSSPRKSVVCEIDDMDGGRNGSCDTITNVGTAVVFAVHKLAWYKQYFAIVGC